MVISGLSADEQALLDRLVEQLRVKRQRNELRSAYMDAKHLVRKLPPTVPDYIRHAGIVLGWPSKAVDAVARRAKLDGFAIPGMDLETFGLDSIIDANDYIRESRIAHLGSLEHGPEFLISTRGEGAEPEIVITRRSALDGTGDWNPRTRHLDNFLSVVEWSKSNRDPAEFNLYLPGVTVLVANGRVVARSEHNLPRIPVEALVYKARDGRPFGSSRITRPVMAITSSAVRTIMRSEGTADFYSAPVIALLGASEDTFGSSPRLQMLMSNMFGIPDDDNAINPRVDMRQVQQASQEPHVKQLETWAQLFAAETSIPVSSLGIGMTQANPTSAESYTASREDLIDEAEDAADGWSSAHVRTLQNAWMLAEGESSVPAELMKLRPVWRPADRPTRTAEADWFVKVASVIPELAETDVAIDLLGTRPDHAERIRADLAVARGRRLLGQFADNGVEG